jgi:hypothetical protein
MIASELDQDLALYWIDRDIKEPWAAEILGESLWEALNADVLLLLSRL